MPYRRLTPDFFARECPEAAAALVGKLLCRRMEDGSTVKLRILETEAYCGENDTACHAHKGRTRRTEVLYAAPGTLYVYLCYGIHWMLNIVTGDIDRPQAILVRSCQGAEGPGKLTRTLGITGALNNKRLGDPDCQIWLEDDGSVPEIRTAPRVGIGYASKEDQERPWRFILI